MDRKTPTETGLRLRMGVEFRLPVSVMSRGPRDFLYFPHVELGLVAVDGRGPGGAGRDRSWHLCGAGRGRPMAERPPGNPLARVPVSDRRGSAGDGVWTYQRLRRQRHLVGILLLRQGAGPAARAARSARPDGTAPGSL